MFQFCAFMQNLQLVTEYEYGELLPTCDHTFMPANNAILRGHGAGDTGTIWQQTNPR